MRNIPATIVTLSGVEVDLLDPEIMDIPISDIANSLARTCRFGNQIPVFMSVAEHSINAAKLTKYLYQDLALEKMAFCHEFAEAIFGDMPSPLKYEPSLQGYKFLEKQTMKLFYMRFCGVSKQRKEVHIVDEMLLCWEAWHLNKYIFNKIAERVTEAQNFVTQVNDLLGKPECLPYEEILVRFNNKFQELFEPNKIYKRLC